MEEKHYNAAVAMPNAAVCFNFVRDGQRLKKSSWMVPHVVRHKDDADLISWRCSWGHVCESECFYALTQEKAGRQESHREPFTNTALDPMAIPVSQAPV